jgi:replicative DNA helicase
MTMNSAGRSTGTALSIARPRQPRAGDPFDTSHIACEWAERQYLAGVLDLLDRDINRVRDLVGKVTQSMFRSQTCDQIYAALRDAVSDIDRPTRADVLCRIRRQAVASQIDEHTDPARALFIELLADTLGGGPQAVRLADEAAAAILEAHTRRQGIELAAVYVGRLRDGSASGDDLAALARELDAVRAVATSANKPLTFVDAVAAWAAHEKAPTVRTLLQPFDEATEGGLPIGGLTAFVAPPQVGKSALATQMAVGAMLADDDLRVVYGLGEMTPQALARRAACVGAGLLGITAVTMQAAGKRSDEARYALDSLTERIGDRMTIVPAPLTVDRIDEQVVRTGAQLVVVDYLQLMQGEGNDRVQELDGIIGRIRQMAINREAAVIVISSMSKAAGPGSRIGQYARGSGEIDYAVELLYVGTAAEQADEYGIVDVTWACKKARNLPQIDIEVRFDGACQTFAPPCVAFPEFNDFRP